MCKLLCLFIIIIIIIIIIIFTNIQIIFEFDLFDLVKHI